MKRAVLYARVSREGWQTRRRKLMSQLQICRQFAVDRGWRIVAELAEDDERTPGSDTNLPQLRIMMELAAAREFDVLVVSEMDRLSRKLAKQILIEEELGRFGIDIRYVLVDYPETPDGQLAKYIRAVIAEYEQKNN